MTKIPVRRPVTGIDMRIKESARAIERVVAFAARSGRWKRLCQRVFDEHLNPVCDATGMDLDGIAGLLGENWQTIEMCAFEDFLSRHEGPNARSVLDAYLEEDGARCPVAEREYLEALRHSLFSLYEVTEVRPERGVVVRDLLRGGDPIEVDERLGSYDIVRWDRLAARVIAIGGRNCFSSGILLFDAAAVDTLLKGLPSIEEEDDLIGLSEEPELASLADEPDMSALLEAAAPAITNAWMALAIDRLSTPPPAILNGDGEALTFVTVRFPIEKKAAAEIAKRLDSAPELVRGDKDNWQWERSGDEQPRKRDGRDKGLSFSTWTQDGTNLILGSVELRKKYLVLSVNSVERSGRGIEMLSNLLRGWIGKPKVNVERIEDIRERQNTFGASPPQHEPPPPEAREAILRVMDRHYHGILEKPLPAIGNVSPREAVRTAEGREKVIQWLKFLENSEARRATESGDAPYDFTWMWGELGLLQERR